MEIDQKLVIEIREICPTMTTILINTIGKKF